MKRSIHYKLTEESIIVGSRKLYRIQALIDMPQHGVNVGDLGGFIQSYENLLDNAWVADNTQVYGNARVYGNALVYGDAWVYGDVRNLVIKDDKQRPVTKWDILKSRNKK